MRATALTLGLICAAAQVARADVLTLADAQLVHTPLSSDPPHPPRPFVAERHTLLPDQVGRSSPGELGVTWFRVALGGAPAPGPHALYVPHAHPNVVVYLNGEWLGQGGRFSEPVAHVWNRPLLFEFDGARLRDGENVLELGLARDGSVFNRLGPLQLGPLRELRPRYERAHALRIPPAEASTVMSVVIMVLCVLMGAALRERQYWLLAAASACYAIASLNCHLREPPLHGWPFNTLTNLCLQWAGFALAQLGFSWAGADGRAVRVCTVLALAGTGLAALLLPGPAFERWMLLGHAVLAVHVVLSLVAIARARSRLTPLEWRAYVTIGGVFACVGLRDIWLLVSQVQGVRGPDSVYVVPYFGALILLVAASTLLARFLRVYRDAQRTIVEREQALAMQSAELRRQHELLRASEQQQAVLEERARFVREMHDGVGGHLVAAASLLRGPATAAGEAERAVRDALDELRLVITANDPLLGDVGLLLGEFRRRIEARLHARGLRFAWQVSPRDPLPSLPPFVALNVLRILQEAVTNALEHARAKTVFVRCGALGAQGSYFEIADDGRWLEPALGTGRGLLFMEQRAAHIGARLSLSKGQAGTAVRLELGAPS